MMSEDTSTTRRREGVIASLRSEVNLLYGGLLLLVVVTLSLTAYVLHDRVPLTALSYYMIVFGMAWVGIFSIYCAVLTVTTTLERGAPLKTRLIWWNGAACIIGTIATLLLAMAFVVYKALFSGMV